MKKILLLFGIMIMLVCPQRMWADDVQWTDVSTAQEFYDAIKKTDSKGNHNTNVRLIADIDLSNHSEDGNDCIFNFCFSGKIYGKYTTDDGKETMHALMNSKKHLLFNYLSDAEISYITVKDCSFEGWDNHSGWFGTEAYRTTFDHIVLYNVQGTSTFNIYNTEKDRMGGIVGEASDNCVFSNIMAMNVNIESDGFIAGCIAGKVNGCKFKNIITNLKCGVFADGNEEQGGMNPNTRAYNGSVVGYAVNCTLEECVNYGLIASNDDRTGGIIGYGSNVSLKDCYNYGIVAHLKHSQYTDVRSRSIAAATEKYATSEYGVNHFYSMLWGIGGAMSIISAGMYAIALLDASGLAASHLAFYSILGISSFTFMVGVTIVTLPYIIYLYQDPDEVGGIAGHLEGGSKAIGCINYGYVKSADAYGGGIVGYLKSSTVTDCCNSNIVEGAEQTGGIVGMNEKGTIKSCLNLSGITVEEQSVKGREIEGDTIGPVHLFGNCYTAVEDKADAMSMAVSQKSLASGSVAAYLNNCSPSTEKRWTQMIGTDLYPSPTAVIQDTLAITESNIDDKANYISRVSNASDFIRILRNPCATVELTGDIDFTSASAEYITGMTPFSGAIHGNGHILRNNTIHALEKDDGDSENDNVAMFSIASHAIFENIGIDNFGIEQEDDADFVDSKHTEAFITGSSYNCLYENIKVTNSSILVNNDNDYLAEVGGIVAISNKDTIRNCTVEGSCQFQGYSGWKLTDTNVGGIVSKAYGTVISGCHNAAKIWADDDHEGGIAAYAENCTIDRCLNTGGITAQEYVGGICGYGKNTSITRCVNTAWIDDDGNTREDYRSGIVGYLDGSKAIVSDCLNFGSINYADDNCAPINDKRVNGATYGTGNLYYCQFNGSHIDNTEKTVNATYAKMLSGEFAYNSGWLYQDLDNNKYLTKMPVPIAAAGVVYKNYHCDADSTLCYSNNFKAERGHTYNGYAGLCTVCGNIGSAPANVTVSNADELKIVAYCTNNGMNYSKTIFDMTDDIDMTGVADYEPIGNNSSHIFRGTFNGNGHRIKNLNINRDAQGTGLFGYIGAGTVIDGIIIDSSCKIASSSYRTAAHVASVLDKESTDTTIIQNCGNEATVIGTSSLGGILGGTDYDNKVNIIIRNCYNTGAISGEDPSAISGYTPIATVENSWNIGTITKSGKSYLESKKFADVGTIKNCYDINGEDGTTKINANDIRYGVLCKKLNANRSNMSAWAQDIATDAYPTFGDAGLRYSRNISSQWGTAVLPFTIYSNDSVQLYTIDNVDANNVIRMKAVESVERNTPCFFKVSDGTENILFFDTKADCNDSDNLTKAFSTSAGTVNLIGSYTKEAISTSAGTSNYYIADNKLWMSSGEFTLPAFRAYLKMSLSSAAKAGAILTIADPDNETTAIGEISADGNVTLYNQPVYNLAGQRQSGLQRGQINIVGGKKIYVR